MNCKCQICGNHGVDMYDVCTNCNWENDDSLFIDEDNCHSVSYDLQPYQMNWFSSANHCSPKEFKKKYLGGR